MIAVIFEVCIKEGQEDAYLSQAKVLREFLDGVEGFISIERFRSLADPERLLSLSYWSDLQAVERWRANADHAVAQVLGRDEIFSSYTIRTAEVIRERTFGAS